MANKIIASPKFHKFYIKLPIDNINYLLPFLQTICLVFGYFQHSYRLFTVIGLASNNISLVLQSFDTTNWHEIIIGTVLNRTGSETRTLL